jgi:hypothetical protein
MNIDEAGGWRFVFVLVMFYKRPGESSSGNKNKAGIFLTL